MIESIEQGRKEDGNRSIADKIIKRLHDIEKTVENNRGRWVWELLQNAKDSISECQGRKVAVQIEITNDSVIFSHNGLPFTEKDVRGIINQISSKEVEEGEISKNTGRFGTGFITTHLLSRVIDIKGIVKTNNKELYSFEFPLDRTGKTTGHLVPNIEKAWDRFHRSVEKLNGSYNQSTLNTSFRYELKSDEQKKIAKIGIEEFKELVPFVLVFVPQIESVRIIDRIDNKDVLYKPNGSLEDGLIASISRIENFIENSILVLNISDQEVSIATIVKTNQEGYVIGDIKNIPKLFCDFPLIGTESFHFPVIINSFYFNPQTERDGIWLKGDDDDEVAENRRLLKKATELYKTLISNISTKPYFNLYNIAESRIPATNRNYFDEEWFKVNIQNPIRELLLNANLVELEDKELGKKAIKELWFPHKSYPDGVRDKIWEFCYDLFPESVCRRNHTKEWSHLSWKDWNILTYADLVSDVEKLGELSKLATSLDVEENEAIEWLNRFVAFILEDETNQILFERSAIIPNMYGKFHKRAELFIDKINDDELIEILLLLNEDWKELLLHKSVGFGKYQVKEKKDISNRITEILKNTRDRGDNYKQAISLLSEWFDYNHPDLGKDLFSELYRKRAELFMNTISDKDSLYKVMRSKTDLAQLSKIAQAVDENPQLLEKIKIADEFSGLLKEFNLKSVEELKSLLANSTNSQKNRPAKVEITKEVLASLGISSIDELEEALKDKDLADLFHASKPNFSAFLYAQNLITRAKTNIIAHLKQHPQYDCEELEELATTVLGGIKKNGVSILVVVRPSDNGEVIIYYSSEKDTLDFAEAELWIDNGRETPRHLTLGRILKTTGINKIPV
ncbi:hypothetical protein [Phaeodactylibacter sp.]|uniref:sacsin N-terminal ATP-binding-like domain-containing protein n=1 Tax=Phaeodactylibacter sp. TaxID=1940289 RepID=UPI0025FAA4F4|nr:hypothetical protein [Phaeodactylibacter sp.]MCI5091178.1 hypothetical protein [Phaeodactylibacter sp.]